MSPNMPYDDSYRKNYIFFSIKFYKSADYLLLQAVISNRDKKRVLWLNRIENNTPPFFPIKNKQAKKYKIENNRLEKWNMYR